MMDIASGDDGSALRAKLVGKREQLRDYIAGIDPTQGEAKRHALAIAEGRLMQIDMDIATLDAHVALALPREQWADAAKIIAGVLCETNMCTGCHRICQCERIAARCVEALSAKPGEQGDLVGSLPSRIY